MSTKLQFYSAMSELGAGTRGASLGMQALKFASLKYDPDFFVKRPIQKIKSENKWLFKSSPKRFAKRLDGIARMYENISDAIAPGLLESKVVIFTGDHSNAGGTIAGIHRAFPHKRLGVIWVDAHADLHSPYTSPTGNVHGMPLANALHEDNIKNQNNSPSEETIRTWNEMKGERKRLRHEDLFYVAMRSAEQPEMNLVKEYGIPNISVDELREIGAKEAAKQALEYLSDCDIIYISFDVDSMDPSVSRGTGTPVAHGLKDSEARDLLLALVEDPRLCCLEITEVNPLLDDKGNSMAEATFQVIKPVIEKIESKLK